MRDLDAGVEEAARGPVPGRDGGPADASRALVVGYWGKWELVLHRSGHITDPFFCSKVVSTRAGSIPEVPQLTLSDRPWFSGIQSVRVLVTFHLATLRPERPFSGGPAETLLVIE